MQIVNSEVDEACGGPCGIARPACRPAQDGVGVMWKTEVREMSAIKKAALFACAAVFLFGAAWVSMTGIMASKAACQAGGDFLHRTDF